MKTCVGLLVWNNILSREGSVNFEGSTNYNGGESVQLLNDVVTLAHA